MRWFILLLLFVWTLWGGEVQIKAKRLEADQKKLVTKFLGGVTFRQGDDTIRAEKAYIYFNKEKKPIKFVVVGNVRFKISHKGKRYEGSAQELVYYPFKKEYLLRKSVHITQYPDQRKISANKVVLDLRSGNLQVEGSEQRPVELIFKIDTE
ncbi:MAG: lipopolysaccharide transport periplasmic protein LptA [Epsilonproteobacteria bacterium]|nr:lipopolysaccharide transport periplasmic protein LptA [Campylobacterota bacterium]NPA57329.1 lipopolysaccharide transport periplasmic protein LptA [Campylobacterota bacterium]